MNPLDVLEKDLAKPGFVEGWLSKLENKTDKFINKLYSCDAGYNSIFIDARSSLSICTFARHISYDLNIQGATLEEGQNILINKINEKKDLIPGDKCYDCKDKKFCRYCPGQFLLENGNETTPIEWNCTYGKALGKAIRSQGAANNE